MSDNVVKCYYSGIESKGHWHQCVKAKVEYVLMSFYQFWNKDEDAIRRRKKKYPFVHFMVDSGAHTFIDACHHGKDTFSKWSEQDFENYVSAYVRWLKKNKDYVTAGVEFDIDFPLNVILGGSKVSTIGPAIVKRWQDKYFKPLQDKMDVIFVWHDERKLEGWEEMCQQFSYVGLPGETSKKPEFNKFISVAKRYTARIHGFGATKQLDFRDAPWYSIDSTTWKSGERYGQLLDWNVHSQRFTIWDKEHRQKFRKKFEQNGFDADAIINDTDYREVTRYSLWAMRQMEAYYANKYKDRVPYYAMRLPPPMRIAGLSFEALKELWKRFRPYALFKQHKDARIPDIRNALQAISCVQMGDLALLATKPDWLAFLKPYFEKLVDPLISDPVAFQREMAMYTSPPNPPAMQRTAPEHFLDNPNAPRARENLVFESESEVDFQLEELAAKLLHDRAVTAAIVFKSEQSKLTE